jgi:FKBP-type peptidyl-prolyl cis-trans isomerase FkpA
MPAAPPKLIGPYATDDENTIYALGLNIARSVGVFEFTPDEMEILKKALSDSLAKKPALELNDWGPRIGPLAQARSAKTAARMKAEGAVFLAKAAAEPGAIKTDSGLIYKETRAGDGASPKPTDTVKVNYRGTLIDGTEFDSSYKRPQPAQFPVGGVIKCWTEGLQRMKVGGKATLVCPSDLAYGDRGQPPTIPAGSTLIFDTELLEVTAPPPPPAPAAPNGASMSVAPARPPVAPAAPPAPAAPKAAPVTLPMK